VRRARSIKNGLIQIKAASDDEEDDSDESEEESESEVEQPPTQKAPRKKSIYILTIYMPLLMHHLVDGRPKPKPKEGSKLPSESPVSLSTTKEASAETLLDMSEVPGAILHLCPSHFVVSDFPSRSR